MTGNFLCYLFSESGSVVTLLPTDQEVPGLVPVTYVGFFFLSSGELFHSSLYTN